MSPLAPAGNACGTCGTAVAVTRDELGMIEQLDNSGRIQCDTCWTAQDAERAAAL